MDRNILQIGPKEFPNKYVISKLLGQGDEGKVFIGFDNLNNTIAIKFVKNKTNYLQEVSCLYKIKSMCDKNLLCLIDNFEYEKYYVIVTDYQPGYITFSDFLVIHDKITKQDKLKIYKKFKFIVHQLHKIKIEHGDLHLDNILINPQTFDIKIIDFGKCTDYSDLVDFEPDWDLIKIDLFREALFQQ